MAHPSTGADSPCDRWKWVDLTAMTYIAIQEALDSKAVDWMEKVSDAQY